MKKEAKRTIYHRLADWLSNLILLACGGIVAWLLLSITTFSSFKIGNTIFNTCKHSLYAGWH